MRESDPGPGETQVWTRQAIDESRGRQGTDRAGPGGGDAPAGSRRARRRIRGGPRDPRREMAWRVVLWACALAAGWLIGGAYFG